MRPELRTVFSPLRIRNFRIYLAGQAVSMVGTWLQMTAQGWVVWELSRSPAALGIVAMLSSFPILALGPLAGVVADRLDRRKLLVATQVGAMTLAFVFASLLWTKAIHIWHVYVLSVLLGVVAALDMPAQQGFLGDLAGLGEVRKAVNLNTMVLQASRLLGPALAGFIIGAFGSAWAFFLNGLSFLAVIASLLAVRSQQVRANGEGSWVGEFGDGLRFIFRQPRVQDLIIFAVLITFFGLPVLNILPAVAGQVLKGDATTLGFLMASSGAGALIGTLFLVPIANTIRRAGMVIWGAVVWVGVWFVVFSLERTLELSALSLFFVSLGTPVVITIGMGLLQVLAPPEMRARLFSFFLMVAFGLQPFASLLIGYSAEHLGTPTAIQINGLLLVVGAALILAFRPKLRRWEVGATSAQDVSEGS